MHRRGKGWALSQQELARLTATIFVSFAIIRVLLENEGELTPMARARLIEMIRLMRPIVEQFVDREMVDLHDKIRADIDERIKDYGVERYTERQVASALQTGRPEDGHAGGTGKRSTSERRPKQVKIGTDPSNWASVSDEELETCPPIGPLVTCPVCDAEHPVLPSNLGPVRLHIVHCPMRAAEGGDPSVLVGINGKDITGFRRD